MDSFDPESKRSEKTSLEFQPGTKILNRYTVDSLLGKGRLGVVYACQDEWRNNRLVAVKILPDYIAQDRNAAAQFEREIKALSLIDHPSVVRFFEQIVGDGFVGFTMEYIEGGTIQELSDSGQHLEINEIVCILGQICSGLLHIHHVGVVHRDLKPANILIAHDFTVKIADFGIAQAACDQKRETRVSRGSDHHRSSLHGTNGSLIGTPEYMSPEYIKHGRCDQRSDIYATGVIAYLLITGRMPYEASSLSHLMSLKLEEDPEPPLSLRRDCPEILSAVVMKALSRSPRKRYPTSLKMLHDLEELLIAVHKEPTEKSQDLLPPIVRGYLSTFSTSHALLLKKGGQRFTDEYSLLGDAAGSSSFSEGSSAAAIFLSGMAAPLRSLYSVFCVRSPKTTMTVASVLFIGVLVSLCIVFNTKLTRAWYSLFPQEKSGEEIRETIRWSLREKWRQNKYRFFTPSNSKTKMYKLPEVREKKEDSEEEKEHRSIEE